MVSSPTVSTAAIFTVTATSVKQDRCRMTTDSSAAYIMNPSMPKVHMRMDAANTALLLEIKPEWKRYVGEKCFIVVQLEGALCGLLESAKL